MSTDRLYLHDSWLHRFEAHITEIVRVKGSVGVVLDRSAFYPESGGQMADRGALIVRRFPTAATGHIDSPEDAHAQRAITDVQVVDDAVVHFLDGRAPEPGTPVTGTLDRSRRRSHMSLHTGQHILSRALLDAAQMDTVSSRLGETQCTIDLDGDKIDERRIADAEALANAVIDDDVVVEALFPNARTLALMPLRKQPPTTKKVRIVRVGDFDLTPCGGTHCTRSAQVGFVRITGVERHKRRVRLRFTAGARARNTMASVHDHMRTLAARFSCGAGGVAAAIDKLENELEHARQQAKALTAVAADALLNGLPNEDGTTVLGLDAPAALVRDLAKRLVQTRPAAVCLLGAREQGTWHVIAARGPDATVHCGAWVKAITQAHGGRGGGRAERAEGKIPGDVDWAAIAAISADE